MTEIPNAQRHFLCSLGFLTLLLAVCFLVNACLGERAAFLATVLLVVVAGIVLLPFGTMVERLVVVAIIGVLIVFVLPAAVEPRGPHHRSWCSNNLKQIGLALSNYHDAYDSFPPAYIADEDGKPMHSWRVLLLPFLEQEALYEQYDFNQPWDGPNNSLLHETIVDTYSCPANDNQGTPLTNYVAVVGPETIFVGDQPLGFDDVTDNTGDTLLVVETAASDIHWMEPCDLATRTMSLAINPDQGRPPGISSNHPGGANVLRVDGSVRFLPDDLPAKTLSGMLTIAGGETIDPNY